MHDATTHPHPTGSTTQGPPEHRAEPCIACGSITDNPKLIRIIEQMSGPGILLYTCPGCAPRYTA